MREIKFAWVCRNKTFNKITREELTDTMLLSGARPSWITSDNCEILAKILPTGLFDKQGKEIYEGDIVKYKERSYGGFYDEDVIVIGEVMFNYSRWRVERRLASPDNRMTPEFEFHYNAKYIEVIGNLYENPELIHSPDIRKGAKE